MFVLLLLVSAGTLGLLVMRFFTNKEIDLSHIPGPSFNPWLQKLVYNKPADRTHTTMQQLARQYGPVMRIPDLGTDVLVVSGFDEIYQVMVKEGVNFGGRPTCFRYKSSRGETGILHNLRPDAKWKTLRKITQQHLRQFGDGMSNIEHVVLGIANDMFSDFDRNVGTPYDPFNIVYETAFANISSLIIGRKGDHSVLTKMKEYAELFLEINTMAPAPALAIMDVFPWLQHLKWPTMKIFKRFNQVESEIWKYAKEYANENPDAHNICSEFDGHSGIDEIDAIKSTLILLIAGVSTSSYTFYGMINMLAHNEDVQRNIFDETEKISRQTGRAISLQDRPQMSYSRAVLLEALRYGSAVSAGSQHKSLRESDVGGYKIPANTTVVTFLWTLHHDEDFWDEPYRFKPDRFLDGQGELVPADHPNRKHLMSFGAGTRVCVGESFAMARLFLWMVNLVQRFEIRPAPGNMKTSTDPRGFKFDGLLKPTVYDVIFTKRK